MGKRLWSLWNPWAAIRYPPDPPCSRGLIIMLEYHMHSGSSAQRKRDSRQRQSRSCHPWAYRWASRRWDIWREKSHRTQGWIHLARYNSKGLMMRATSAVSGALSPEQSALQIGHLWLRDYSVEKWRLPADVSASWQSMSVGIDLRHQTLWCSILLTFPICNESGSNGFCSAREVNVEPRAWISVSMYPYLIKVR